MPQPRRGLLTSLSSMVRTDGSHAAMTDVLPVVDDTVAVRVLDLAVHMGEIMLVTGASASDVTLTIVRVAAAYGVAPVHVDVTYNSITVSHHRVGATSPMTLLRVVRLAAPDHEKLQRLQALSVDISRGVPLGEAKARFRAIRRTPFRYRPAVVVTAQSMLAVGVAVMFGVNGFVIALAFVAALLASATQFGLGKARVPYFFSQIAGAFVLTLVAGLAPLLAYTGWAGTDSIRPSVIVASAIVLMLAGLTVVGAAQDAIDGFALTAMGRILELMTMTLGVVLGILAGLEVTRVIGLPMAAPSEAVPLGPVPVQLLGALVIAIAVAVYNGAGGRIIMVSAVLSVLAWMTYLAALGVGLELAAASGIGAFAASFIGIIVAYRLHVPSVAVTIAAILPMVPGAAVFRGLLTVVEADPGSGAMLIGFGTLVSAAVVGISLAVGASLGIYLGQPVRATLRSVLRSRSHLRR